MIAVLAVASVMAVAAACGGRDDEDRDAAMAGGGSDATRDADAKVEAAVSSNTDAATDARPDAPNMTPPGTLDPSFGDGGIVTIDFGANDDSARAVAVQPDGKIVVAGDGAGDPSSVALARLLPNGALDPTFGDGGKVTTAFTRVNGASARSVIRALALQPDGRIVAGGYAHTSPNAGYEDPPGNGIANDDYVLVRYLASGALDPSFGDGGIVLRAATSESESVNGLAVASDGAIVAAGDWRFISEIRDLTVLKIHADGGADLSFDEDGLLRYRSPRPPGKHTNQFGSAISVANDGSVTVGGGLRRDGENRDHPALFRFGAGGALDPSFGDGGIADRPFEAKVTGTYTPAMQIAADGTIYLGGQVVLRFSSAGQLDQAYADGGVAVVPFDGRALVETGGRIVVAGSKLVAPDYRAALCRLLPNGALDPSFAGGAPTFSFGRSEGLEALARAPDGNLVAVGWVSSFGSTKRDMLVLRVGD